MSTATVSTPPWCRGDCRAFAFGGGESVVARDLAGTHWLHGWRLEWFFAFGLASLHDMFVVEGTVVFGDGLGIEMPNAFTLAEDLPGMR